MSPPFWRKKGKWITFKVNMMILMNLKSMKKDNSTRKAMMIKKCRSISLTTRRSGTSIGMKKK